MSSELLKRRSVVARVLRDRGDTLVVTGLGNSSYDVAGTSDSAHNFYLWGAMGGAAVFGLGLARAQPGRRVLVITGDGEMLMGLGSLATVAVDAPANLGIVVLDNERFAETGMQATHTARGVDLAGIARAAGIADACLVRTADELERRMETLGAAKTTTFTVIKVSSEPNPTALPPRDGPYIRSRFREALLGAAAHR
ncbi:MAG: aldehyde dehydrogenase [Betaproteobacteria bacterium]|nr:aldehyde dehydrogenase [Betaproteobacteria bacterium]